ncbi:GNAT family N-acetyltransferase [Lysobacter korlensis]|uniref:GNAT family N-acetyltransferase n=1 Tax=Lysobacter korlensis TaxID=553636 RepID=A0ABV6RV19_9GAMM
MERRSVVGQAVADHIDTHLVRGEAGRTPDAAWYRTGAPTEHLNGVVWLSGSADAEFVRRLREGFAPTPFLWNAWPELNRGRDDAALLAAGLEFQEEEPLMTMPLDRAPRGETAAVVDVTNDSRIQHWLRVWIGDPSLPDMPDMAAAVRLAGNAARYLLLEQDGVPASCATVVVAGEVGAVENVVTRSDLRRRGLGTTVTVAALQHAHAMGARRAVLTASPDGEGIYRRLGFDPVTTVRRYA